MSDLMPGKDLLLDNGRGMTVDPFSQDSIDHAYQAYELPFRIFPGRRVLMHTQERVRIPSDRIGIICLRSTWARLGLIAPPTVADPGFYGNLTMEIFNGSTAALIIPEGVAMWNMVLLPTEERIYEGRYQGQVGVVVAQAFPRPEGSQE